MLKIYFNDKPLFIADKPTEELLTYVDNPKAIVIHSIEPIEIKQLIKDIQQPDKIAAVIINDEPAALEALKKQFLVVQAAGGLVSSKTEELLLIYRRGKWDLPKGKLDEGEDLQECALREVTEETGLQNLSITKPLCITYHTYRQDGQAILKESHWYLMQTEGEQVLTPQTDEDIEKCEWVLINKLTPYMENTHPSILDVIKEGTRLLTIKQ